MVVVLASKDLLRDRRDCIGIPILGSGVVDGTPNVSIFQALRNDLIIRGGVSGQSFSPR